MDKIALVEARIAGLKRDIEYNVNGYDVRTMLATLALNEQILILLKEKHGIHFRPTTQTNEINPGFFLFTTSQMIEPFMSCMN